MLGMMLKTGCPWRAATFGVIALGICLLSPGCGSSEDESVSESEPVLPAWNDDSEPPKLATQTEQAPADLTLNVQTGDRFPMKKIIDREVTQEIPGEAPRTHHLRIELSLGVTVEDVTSEGIKLAILYDRVIYKLERPGEVLEYDSKYPRPNLPLSIRAYNAMVKDGFSFWIGSDHQIQKAEGFEEFIARCLQDIPDAQRHEVMLSLESSSGDSSIADFVDNAIGLLPPHEQRVPGDFWSRTRHVSRPIPMDIENKYTLLSVTDDLATVGISGVITPSTTVASDPTSGAAQVRMVVEGGTTQGECTLYRDSGLPRKSNVEHDLTMTVFTAENLSFKQRVRGQTTIEAYPQIGGSGRPTPVATSPGPALLPTR